MRLSTVTQKHRLQQQQQQQQPRRTRGSNNLLEVSRRSPRVAWTSQLSSPGVPSAIAPQVVLSEEHLRWGSIIPHCGQCRWGRQFWVPHALAICPYGWGRSYCTVVYSMSTILAARIRYVVVLWCLEWYNVMICFERTIQGDHEILLTHFFRRTFLSYL